MRQTRVVQLVLTAALALTGVAGAATAAQAAPASASTATVAHAPSIVENLGWAFAGYYDTLRSCKDEGNFLYDIDQITNYSCQYSKGRYELYVEWVE